ncbi:MAG TPA: hypothetical protein VGB73_03095 [Pyrinomonadaceae bacterium]
MKSRFSHAEDTGHQSPSGRKSFGESRISDRVARQAHRHVGRLRILTIPRHNPVNALTMGGIVRDAGLTPEEFKKLL